MATKNQLDAPLYNAILKKYADATPIKQIAKELETSEVKVRRVLITEGEWSSPTSEEIYNLYLEGLTPAQIAEKLKKPLKTVQAYMPYTRGEYSDGEISAGAQWSKDFRKRKRSSLERQVSADTKDNKTTAGKIQKADNSINNLKEKRMLTEVLGEWKEDAGYIGEGHKILKLHLELRTDFSDEEEATLRKYGKSEKGISRDILVSSDMMLHNLHYAIQRAFGWQNSHLHNFAYPVDVFQKLTDDKLSKWLDLCGLYFRFPDEENEDIYWDDDYDESVSIRTWLKHKYSPPYTYDGISEHYMYAQTQARSFSQKNPILRIGPSFEEYMVGNTESKIKKIEDISVQEIMSYFESSVDELLERLPLIQVIGLKETDDWENKVKKVIEESDTSFADNYAKINKLYHSENGYELKQTYKKTDPVVIPLSDTLVYSYDYGDSWIVDITCTEIYESFDCYNKPSTKGWIIPNITEEQVFNDQHPFDSRGQAVEGQLRDQIATVISKRKPVCIAADGLPIMDDVGGPSGYIGFLNGIHGKDCGGYPYEEKEESLEWGRGMGWTGRMNKPENIL